MKLVNVIMGPTFSGKTTLLNKALVTIPKSYPIIAHTTRPMRDGEIDGEDYFFDAKYVESKNNICVRKYKVANGDTWYYWIDKNNIAENRVNFVILDYLGFKELFNFYKDDKNTEVTGMFLTTPLSVIKNRINCSSRKDEDKKETYRRLKSDLNDFKDILKDNRVLEIKN